MEDRIQARIAQLVDDSSKARERLDALQGEQAELLRFLQAAAGALEALQDLLKDETE